MIPEQCLGNIMGLIEAQRFIFSVSVSDQDLVKQFQHFLQNLEEFLKRSKLYSHEEEYAMYKEASEQIVIDKVENEVYVEENYTSKNVDKNVSQFNSCENVPSTLENDAPLHSKVGKLKSKNR